VSNIIVTDVQDLEIDSGIVELYEIEIGTGSDNTLYFHPGKDLGNDDADNDLLFDGNTYVALPIFMEGIEKTAEGAQPRPKLTFANVESIIKNNSIFKTEMDDGTWDAEIDNIPITTNNFVMEDLIGARVTRRKTLEKYTGLDENDNPVTGYDFGKELFIIDRISNKSSIFIEVELASPMDLGGVRIPRRQVIGKYCPWIYQGGQTDPGKSACTWKTHEQLEEDNGDVYSFYFTGNDEPLVLASYLTGTTNDFWKGTYSTSTAYVRGDFVSSASLFWRCEKDATGVLPTETAIQWQLVRTYTAWNNSTTYTIDSADFRKNSYVRGEPSTDGANTIWRAVRGNSGITPGTNESAWTRGDTCGKLLKSCKIRYQGMPLANKIASGAYGADAIPSFAVDTNVPLPFGAFPGTRKFR
jgi:phage-related protein